jgi:hypothetical protein
MFKNYQIQNARHTKDSNGRIEERFILCWIIDACMKGCAAEEWNDDCSRLEIL